MSTLSSTAYIDTTTVESRVQSIPWLVWTNVIASVCIATGLYWDISWHETIGRDSFWTPAHLLIQFGALLGAFGSAWVIMRTTFGGDKSAREGSVNVLGFRGPLGAFIAAWGGGAMLTSAPFDNWWHDAYGLDVKIISPPHMLLALGIAGIMWGGVILTVSYFNRATGEQRTALQRMLLFVGGFVVIQGMTLKLEYINRVLLHSGISYLVISIGCLLILEGPARLWPSLGADHYDRCLLWLCPEPDVVLAALSCPTQTRAGISGHHAYGAAALSSSAYGSCVFSGLDVASFFKQAPKWQQAIFGGVAFLAILIAVEWPFATFLMTPVARNWFFATIDFPYFALPTSPTVNHIFVHWEQTAAAFWRNMGLAFLFSVISMWAGIYWGEWLKKVKR